MKRFLIGAAAAAATIAIAPAVAQTANPAPAPAAAPAPMVHHWGMAGKTKTRAEVLTKVREHFARLDTDRDGFITKAETEAKHVEMRAKHMADRAPMRAQMFDRMDSNRDGSISRAEFAAAPTRQERHIVMRRDGKGEAMRMRGGHGKGGMGMMHGRMFEMADANRDGRVSMQEATDAALRHFDTADLNRDGQLTPDERRQMHQLKRAGRRPA